MWWELSDRLGTGKKCGMKACKSMNVTDVNVSLIDECHTYCQLKEHKFLITPSKTSGIMVL